MTPPEPHNRESVDDTDCVMTFVCRNLSAISSRFNVFDRGQTIGERSGQGPWRKWSVRFTAADVWKPMYFIKGGSRDQTKLVMTKHSWYCPYAAFSRASSATWIPSDAMCLKKKIEIFAAYKADVEATERSFDDRHGHYEERWQTATSLHHASMTRETTNTFSHNREHPYYAQFLICQRFRT